MEEFCNDITLYQSASPILCSISKDCFLPLNKGEWLQENRVTYYKRYILNILWHGEQIQVIDHTKSNIPSGADITMFLRNLANKMAADSPVTYFTIW